jgi:hypothetical protein
MESNKSTLNFIFKLDKCNTVNNITPEAAIAYDEVFIRDVFARHKLGIREPIFYGNWCGRTNLPQLPKARSDGLPEKGLPQEGQGVLHARYQDIIIAMPLSK